MAFTREQFRSVLRRNTEYLRRARSAYRDRDCRDAVRAYSDFARTTGALVAMELATSGLDKKERAEVAKRAKTLDTFQVGLRRRCVRP
jgi:hypothetical protein